MVHTSKTKSLCILNLTYFGQIDLSTRLSPTVPVSHSSFGAVMIYRNKYDFEFFLLMQFRYDIFTFYISLDCGASPGISNGGVSNSGTTFGSTATYTCNTGYTLSGTASINCQANSAWETAPTCVIVGQYLLYYPFEELTLSSTGSILSICFQILYCML